MVTQPLPWAACSNAWQPFSVKKFFLIPNPNFTLCNFTESESSRLEKTLKIIQSNHQLNINSSQLHHIPKCHIYTSFKYLQGWSLNHFPGQPVPMLDNSFGEKIFPNNPSKPPLVQLEVVSSRPITCYLGEVTNTHLAATSFQVVAGSDKVSPEPPFLQPQFPQPLLIRRVL